MRHVTLKPGRAKPLWLGHPWVFADSVGAVAEGEADDAAPADWVRVVDADGKTVGHGFHSPDSAIAVRLLARGPEGGDPEALLVERVQRAAALRARLFPDAGRTSAYRLVHADGDGLPGLVVDRLGDVLVAQFATAAMHARRDALAAALLAATGARSLVGRAGGFERVERIAPDEAPFLVGEPAPERVAIVEEGLHLEAAPLAGQKTGHYADQRENRVRVAEVCAGLRVLDLYAGTGGFSLQALRAGAASARAVDTSARSVAAARAAAVRNGVAERFEAEAADAKDVLGALRAARARYDVVIADPPNFFPRRGPPRGALKAYRELNVRALSRVAPGGFLATFTCSAKLPAPAFLELLRSASRECRRGFAVLRELEAGPDHPVAAGLPESRYLSGLLLHLDG
jgi:23S rRNA (cytosine1962-C5)-methyltransferase